MGTINVFLTVDVECSIGGAFADPKLKPVGGHKRIFGRFRGREYGIPLMMDIAEGYGLPLVFFVETFQHLYFGSRYTREVVETVLPRKHDIQLHLHPNYLNFTLIRPQDRKFSDLCGDYHPDQQIEMIAWARKMLMDCGAPRPMAFRAGCFGADLNTLQALKQNDFLIDSSYCQAFIGAGCLLPDHQLNDVSEEEGIFEFPITHLHECSRLRAAGPKPLDINGVSFQEIRQVLNQARRGSGPGTVTMLLHSFSFLKPYDVQYRKVRPRWNVIRRFERLCRFLAENPSDFRVRTFGELHREALEEAAKNARHEWPRVPAPATWVRLAAQAMDRWL